jgi:nicotinamide mononucleotide (NMN) deamidase PncC
MIRLLGLFGAAAAPAASDHWSRGAQARFAVIGISVMAVTGAGTSRQSPVGQAVFAILELPKRAL